jgi:CHASE3 domain sensor protein
MDKQLHKRLISTFLLLGLITLIILGTVAYLQYDRLSNGRDSLIESYQTIRAANQSLISINEAAIDIGVFLQTKDASILKKIPEIITAAQVNFETLEQLIHDNANQLDLFTKLKPLFQSKLLFLTTIINKYDMGKMDESLQIAADKDRLKLTDAITQYIIAIKQLEIGQLDLNNEKLLNFKKDAQRLLIGVGLISAFFFICFCVLLDKYMKRY